MAPLQEQSADYDLTPFLQLSVCAKRYAYSERLVLPRAIPDIETPSPLASFITPQQLRKTRNYWCGSPPSSSEKCAAAVQSHGLLTSESSKKQPLTATRGNVEDASKLKRGEEVWRSWKRAYDLWNGFYVEGRINDTWIGLQYNEMRIQQSSGFAVHDHEEDDGEYRGLLQGSIEQRQAIKDKVKTFTPADIGAGFYPLKSFPEFAPATNSLDDNIQNTIWRPRRVGELENDPVVEIDGDISEWFENQIEGVRDRTGFNGWVDGGFDCRRSPLPVLRSRIIYKQPSGTDIDHEHIYAKQQIWDGVTGTILNVPTTPHSSGKLQDDRKHIESKTIYTDPIRDSRADNHGHVNKGTFPLDIRRCERRKPYPSPPGKDARTARTELVINQDDDYDLPQGRVFLKNDPWYVTQDQRNLRDVPTRFQPPVTNREASHMEEDPVLPVDSRSWDEEREKDSTLEAAYFVANTHGGFLMINGVEILTGTIAGPLPKFAIIETEGGQVSFWWGVGGREYGASKRDARSVSSFRHLKGPSWLHINQSAGKVWLEKIAARLTRESSGDPQHDDEIWQNYSHAGELAGHESIAGQPITNVEDVWDGDIDKKATAFISSTDELKYLVLRSEAAKEEQRLNRVAPGTVFPLNAWFGIKPPALSPKQIARQKALDFWAGKCDEILQCQTAYMKQLQEEMGVEQTKAGLKGVKRKAGEDFDDNAISSKQLKHDPRLVFYAQKLKKLRQEQKSKLEVVLESRPTADDDRITREFWQRENRLEEAAKHKRAIINNDNKLKSLPLIAAPWGPFTKKEVADFITRQEEQVRIKNAYDQVLNKANDEENNKWHDENKRYLGSTSHQALLRKKAWEEKQAQDLKDDRSVAVQLEEDTRREIAREVIAELQKMAQNSEVGCDSSLRSRGLLV